MKFVPKGVIRVVSRVYGLTIVEVMIALAIVGVVVAILTTVTLSSVRYDANSGSRTQAVQILNYLGRLASASDALLLNGSRSWDYGELQGTFTELRVEAHRADPAFYRAEVQALGTSSVGSSVVDLYRVTVCWQLIDQESCVQGETAGPPQPPAGEDPYPPVIN